MTATEHDLTPGTFDKALEDYLDDRGLRYEVLDGEIVVNASATWDHEDAAAEILTSLRGAAPENLAVMGSQFGFHYAPGSFLLPDVTVCLRADRSPDGLHVAPQLVVEVLSPTSARRDLGRKKEIYRDAGVPSYWVVDPEAQTLSVLSLVDGEYVETARLDGPGELTVSEPFPVTVSPWGAG